MSDRTYERESYSSSRLRLVAFVAALVVAVSPAHAADDKRSAAQKKSPDLTSKVQQIASDAWLDGKLEAALLFNEHLDSFDIHTEVRDGTARLSGSVGSDIDRELAGVVAKSIDGIEKVENKLKIDASAAESAAESKSYQEKSEWRQTIANATLTATVKSRLLLNEHTSGLAINVDSTNGVVTLSGTVDSGEEAELAEQIASNVADVREVNNRLQVDAEQSS